MKIPNEKAGLNKRRHAMPQIADYSAFKKDLDENDIAVVDMDIPAAELTPTQGNFSEEKVNTIRADKKAKHKPIITSSDDFVLDGHHRWLAAAQDDGEVACRVVDMPMDELLDFVEGKPYVENKKLNEALTPGLQKIQDYYARTARVEGGEQFARLLNRVNMVTELVRSNKDRAIKKRNDINRYLDKINDLLVEQ